MSQYLEEAARLLRKSADANEEHNVTYKKSLEAGRERIARHFTLLAAIDRGVLPQELAKELFITEQPAQ